MIRSAAIFISLSMLVSVVLAQAQAPVFTATKVFQERLTTSPFITTKSTTVVWTQSPSISEADTVTATTTYDGIPPSLTQGRV
ncbi:hypothetical protein HGRIS_005296 [Hohenbuehelia grisea]|uniref:Uncharacterized protein n=1 Tax=Hohenbuehelia grisea TaxID=104357 RepID=A0ABR3JG77_9AGAR